MNKKFLVGCGAVASAVSAFAEGTVSAPADLLTQAQTSLQNLLTAALPIVATIVGTGLALWGAFKLYAVIKRAFATGTGR